MYTSWNQAIPKEDISDWADFGHLGVTLHDITHSWMFSFNPNSVLCPVHEGYKYEGRASLLGFKVLYLCEQTGKVSVLLLLLLLIFKINI